MYPFELDSNAFFRGVKGAPEASRSVIKAAEASTVPKGHAIKGKALDDTWAITIHVKAESPIDRGKEGIRAYEEEETATVKQPNVSFKMLKRRMKSSFKEIRESLSAQKLPEPDVIHAFLSDSEGMTAFSGEEYGEHHYPSYRKACRRF